MFYNRILFPEVEDILIFAHEHNLLEAGDVRGFWGAVFMGGGCGSGPGCVW